MSEERSPYEFSKHPLASAKIALMEICVAEDMRVILYMVFSDLATAYGIRSLGNDQEADLKQQEIDKSKQRGRDYRRISEIIAPHIDTITSYYSGRTDIGPIEQNKQIAKEIESIAIASRSMRLKILSRDGKQS